MSPKGEPERILKKMILRYFERTNSQDMLDKRNSYDISSKDELKKRLIELAKKSIREKIEIYIRGYDFSRIVSDNNPELAQERLKKWLRTKTVHQILQIKTLSAGSKPKYNSRFFGGWGVHIEVVGLLILSQIDEVRLFELDEIIKIIREA